MLKKLLFFVVCILLANPVFAQINMENPRLEQMQFVLVYVINTLLICCGIAFVGFIAYGAWKASMALGDPRGLEGAKQAWTNAVVGAFIVLASMVIFGIILGFLGISVGDIAGNIMSGLQSLVSDVR